MVLTSVAIILGAMPDALSITNGMLQLLDPAHTNFPARYYRTLEHLQTQ